MKSYGSYLLSGIKTYLPCGSYIEWAFLQRGYVAVLYLENGELETLSFQSRADCSASRVFTKLEPDINDFRQNERRLGHVVGSGFLIVAHQDHLRARLCEQNAGSFTALRVMRVLRIARVARFTSLGRVSKSRLSASAQVRRCLCPLSWFEGRGNKGNLEGIKS